MHYKFITSFTLIISLLCISCSGQISKSDSSNKIIVNEQAALTQEESKKVKTTFPQIHTNLDGMVREFVWTMHQDKKSNYWFGTNGNGIIKYDGSELINVSLNENLPGGAVRDIIEDKNGNIYLGTSEGLIKYDGQSYHHFPISENEQDNEIWDLMMDEKNKLWASTNGGSFIFENDSFTHFPVPRANISGARAMLATTRIIKTFQDNNEKLWFITDGYGITTFNGNEFNHLTMAEGLPDNHVADIIEDSDGHIWISSYNGGVTRYDGTRFTNFTLDGIIEGEEAYNFCIDKNDNLWFSVEHVGVYKFDGKTFTNYTEKNGLTTNGVLSISEDHKGQIWFGTWKGLSIFDGKVFSNAVLKEPWTK